MKHVDENNIGKINNSLLEINREKARHVRVQLKINSYDKKGLHDWILGLIQSELKMIREDSVIKKILNIIPDSTPEKICLLVSKSKYLRKKLVFDLNSKLLRNKSFFITDLIFKQENNNKLEIWIDLERVSITRIINRFLIRYEMQMKYGDLLKSIIVISNDAISEEVKWSIVKKVIKESQFEIRKIVGDVVEAEIGVKLEVGGIRIF